MPVAESLRAWSRWRVGSLPGFPFVAAGIYALALALPAVSAPGAPVYTGFNLLLEGWRGVGGGVFAWFANPLFQAALLLAIADYRRWAGVLAGIGCVLGLTSFAATTLARANGLALPELDYAAGFYVWLAAQFALFAWCWAGLGAAGSDSGAKELPARGENGIDRPSEPP